MNTMFLPAIALLVLLAQDSDPISVRRTNGTISEVEVLGLEGDLATLQMKVLDGSMRVRRRLSDFEPRSAFRIALTATQPDSFEAHFELAKVAADFRLADRAGDQARAAIDAAADSEDAEVKALEVRSWAADTLVVWLEEAIDSGDQRGAVEYLELLSTRLADQRSEEELDTLVVKVDALEEEAEARRQAERQARLDERARADLERRLRPIRSNIETGDRRLRDAIAQSRRTSRSVSLASQAIDAYRSAWRAAEALRDQNPDDAALGAEVESMGLHIHEHGVQAALHAANMLTVQSDYVGAREWAEKVLAFDSGNVEAREMLRTIQISDAASTDWAWGWGRGGRGGGEGREGGIGGGGIGGGGSRPAPSRR
jgi:hypothetical protein